MFSCKGPIYLIAAVIVVRANCCFTVVHRDCRWNAIEGPLMKTRYKGPNIWRGSFMDSVDLGGVGTVICWNACYSSIYFGWAIFNCIAYIGSVVPI